MKKQLLLSLSLAFGLATGSYAQFSAGAMAGVGYSSQQQKSSLPEYALLDVDAVQPVIMAGVYGQFTTKGKRGLVAGLQLQYQEQRQTHGTLGHPQGLGAGNRRYNRYNYLVATPYVGIRLLNKLEIAAGPEISSLLQSRLASIPRNRKPAKHIIGYNIRATYWLNRFGLEGGYSRQNTAFDSQQEPNVAFRFYNRYVYGAVKYNLTRRAR